MNAILVVTNIRCPKS